MCVGSAVFGVVGRPDLFGAGLRGAAEGAAIIAAQLAGITISAGVFFRKIEAHFRLKYFSFYTLNDNKCQRASLIIDILTDKLSHPLSPAARYVKRGDIPMTVGSVGLGFKFQGLPARIK